MKEIYFTTKEKEIIAEFIYSYEQDVLIKSDAEDLSLVLLNHGIIHNMDSWKKDINNNMNNVATRLIKVMQQNISEAQINQIMKNYFGEIS